MTDLRCEIHEASIIVRALTEAAARITDCDRAVMLHSQTGEVLDCNQAASDLLGVPADVLVGRALGDGGGELFYTVESTGRAMPCDRFPVARALRGETVVAEVVGVFRASGWFSWLSVDAAPLGPGGLVLVSFVEVEPSVAIPC
ncbi:MAG: hypothetical protein AAFZ07_25710 [Actinomycetota bacterium]